MNEEDTCPFCKRDLNHVIDCNECAISPDLRKGYNKPLDFNEPNYYDIQDEED